MEKFFEVDFGGGKRVLIPLQRIISITDVKENFVELRIWTGYNVMRDFIANISYEHISSFISSLNQPILKVGKLSVK